MENTKTHTLVLHNDKSNDFLYVIACLIRLCNQNPIQAEQCAILTHYKGKYPIKTGDFSELLDLHHSFKELDLKTEVESYESYMY